MAVVTFFGRRRKRVVVPRLHSRSDPQANVNRVDLGELTPGLLPYLGQAAYLQLTIFETLGRAIATAPSTEAKEAVSRVAALSLTKHHALVAEIERKGETAGVVMEPYRDRIDAYGSILTGRYWQETLVASYLTAGLLDDFFVRLASGLPGETTARITKLFAQDSGSDILVDLLRTEIDANPHLASRLAMWGRRLVGDTLLIARSALALPVESAKAEEERLEPIFTELIAAHTRRMDALGLTA
jgi:hypothetical protein